MIGASRSGKSVLIDHLIRWYVQGSRKRRVLVADTKPRFRAEETPHGFSASRYYKNWAPAPVTPGSVRLDLGKNKPLKGIWQRYTIAMAQVDALESVPLVQDTIRQFFDEANVRDHDQLVVVDEMGDFYLPNGYPRGGRDEITRTQRAGGELGIGTLLASQRAKGIPIQALSEAGVVILFQQNFTKELDRLRECGYPGGIAAPTAADPKGTFLFWRRGMPAPVACRLQLTDSYSASLSPY